MKTNFPLVQEEVLTAKFNGGKARIFLLPGVCAPKVPDFIRIIIVHRSARCRDKLIEIWGQIALDKGIVSGEATEYCKLLRCDLILRILQVFICCFLEKVFMLLKPIQRSILVRSVPVSVQKFLTVLFVCHSKIRYL